MMLHSLIETSKHVEAEAGTLDFSSIPAVARLTVATFSPIFRGTSQSIFLKVGWRPHLSQPLFFLSWGKGRPRTDNDHALRSSCLEERRVWLLLSFG